MNATLTCGRCGKRWRYSGDKPTAAIEAHQAEAHPEMKTDARPGEVFETPAELQGEP